MKTPVIQGAKICANCSFWSGPREMNGFFGRMEVEMSGNTTGKCTNRDGFFNCSTNWQQSCPRFEKHPIVH